VIIARLVSVEDFGIASTFALVMFLVEVMPAMSLDRLIIQARDGYSAAFKSTAQAPLLAAWWLMPEFTPWTNLLLQRW
jgi:hypothetical protein